jgi:hypothetical protein
MCFLLLGAKMDLMVAMEITLEKLNAEGFLFHQFEQSLLSGTDEEVTAKMIEYVSGLLKVEGEYLEADYDYIQSGEQIKPHFHVIPGSFQVVIWLPQGEFIGRNFLYGKDGVLKQYHPEKGMMCFMKSNDPRFIHGVSVLESPETIKTLGLSSIIKKLDGNRDIFVEQYTII